MNDKQATANSVTAARPTTTRKPRSRAPVIEATTRLKWGLALLGEPAAEEYLTWLRRRLQRDSGDSLHTDSHTSTHNP